VCTRCEHKTRAAGASARTRRHQGALGDPLDEVAAVAAARRDLLLRVHRHRLRREDLEDSYSQATLELLAHVRAGGAFSGLYRSGIRPIAEIVARNPLAQDYLDWGAPGTGRWVSIYATATPTAHVFIVIAGLRLDTSHNGTDVGPNSGQDGPRWRILDHIPTWARWSVRHPPGL
jgi:hypothetical protein